jgi:signal transduction histidine kinase
VLGGLRLWPGVWLGLTAANLTVQPSIVAPFVIGAGGALEALFIAWGMARFVGRPEALFASADHVFRLVGLALGGAAMSASVANLALGAAGTLGTEAWALNWLTWWLGDTMGVILVLPLVVAFAAHRGAALTRARVAELALAGATLAAITVLVFLEWPPTGRTQAITFLLLPPLVWIAARFDAREVTSAAAATGALAMFATVLGRGPFVSTSLNESLLLQQAFVCTIAVVGLALTVAINGLRRARQELEELVSLASHDLREPVRNTLGYADLLQRRYGARLDDDAHEFLGYIVAGALRMGRLIDNLLALSRAGLPALALQRVDSAAALDSALDGLSHAIAEAGAEVTREPLPIVLADALLFEQLLQNLVANAVKFRASAAPKIHVSARRDARRWVFSVRDNGIGIAPANHDKIFGMFERLHGRGGGGGAGVGLALCRRIVERHGGRIWVESGEMQGATFRFSIAAADDAGE